MGECDWNNCSGKIQADALQRQIDDTKKWAENNFIELYKKDDKMREELEAKYEKFDRKVDKLVQAVSGLKIWILSGLVLFLIASFAAPMLSKTFFP